MPSLDSWEHCDIEDALGELNSSGEELEYLDAKEGLTPGEMEEAMFRYHFVPGRPTSSITGSDRGEDKICGEEILELEESGILIPVTELFALDHQVGNQCCVRSLGHFVRISTLTT